MIPSLLLNPIGVQRIRFKYMGIVTCFPHPSFIEIKKSREHSLELPCSGEAADARTLKNSKRLHADPAPSYGTHSRLFTVSPIIRLNKRWIEAIQYMN